VLAPLLPLTSPPLQPPCPKTPTNAYVRATWSRKEALFEEAVIGGGAYGALLLGSGAAEGILRADQIDLDNLGRHEFEAENHWHKILIRL
jgi:hypothetical protein